MTDREKMRRLFEAAMRAPDPESTILRRAFPEPKSSPVPHLAEAAPQVEPPPEEVADEEPAAAADVIEEVPENVGLDEQSSRELGILLDAQMKRKARKRLQEMVASVVVLLAVSGGSFGWFVQSADRVAAAKSAYHDLRSIGDVAGMVSAYKKSLAKIAARSHEVDKATADLGMSTDLKNETDVHMDAEMRSMMIGEGKTTGDRNQLLVKKMGAAVKTIAPDAAASMELPAAD